MPQTNQLFMEILDALRRQVTAGYGPGEKLPSQRDLAAMHGVGLTTVHRAVKVLIEEGLIESRPGSGIVRARNGRGKRAVPARKEASRIGILTRRRETEWIRKKDRLPHYTAIKEEAERRGVDVVWVTNRRRLHPTPKSNKVELGRVQWNQFDVGLLIEVEDFETLTHPSVKRRKVIAVDQDATRFGVHSVSFDDRELGRFAARHLWEMGHRRFALTEEVSGPGFPAEDAWAVRNQGFMEMTGRLGGVVRSDWRVDVPWRERGTGITMPQAASDIAAHWASLKPKHRPTALFAASASILPLLISELRKHGLHVPRDLSIVTVTWHEDERARYEKKAKKSRVEKEAGSLLFTHIHLDLPTLTRRLLDAVEDLAADRPLRGGLPAGAMSGNDACLVTAPFVLKKGETTAPPPGGS